jgi:hypothetical protein
VAISTNVGGGGSNDSGSGGLLDAVAYTIPDTAFPCSASVQRLVSQGMLWCVHATTRHSPKTTTTPSPRGHRKTVAGLRHNVTLTDVSNKRGRRSSTAAPPIVERWAAFSIKHNQSIGSVDVQLPQQYTTSPSRRWVLPSNQSDVDFDSASSYATAAAVVLVEPEGDWLYASLPVEANSTTDPLYSTVTTAVVVLSNFTSARIGATCDATLLGPPSAALPLWLSGGVGVAVCVESASGYWHAASLAPGAGPQQQHVIGVWKYSHGGVSSAVLPPATNGTTGRVPLVHTDYYIARVAADGAPRPLACNVTSSAAGLAMGVATACLVMPPGDNINSTFQPNAPSLKSTNINLWSDWHLAFSPETYTGGWGAYDSADLLQARFIFDRLTSAGVSFYITDNTNGIGCDFGNTFDATRRMAMLAATYNAEPGRDGRTIKYAISVGVNPLG